MLIFENKMNYPKTWEPGERKEMQGKMTNNSRAKAKSTFIHLISVIRIHISFGTKKKIPEKMSDTKLRWNAEFEFLSVPTLCAHELIFKHECAISFFFDFEMKQQIHKLLAIHHSPVSLSFCACGTCARWWGKICGLGIGLYFRMCTNMQKNYCYYGKTPYRTELIRPGIYCTKC